MPNVKLRTGPGVFEVLANVCRNPHEALKQFVENAADAIEQGNIEDGHIEIKLKYGPSANGQTRGILESVSIEDNGTGISKEKMTQVLYSIGDSEKINLALRGEQGIGLLAFALLAQEIHLTSSTRDGSSSSCLVLKRNWLKRGHAAVDEQCSTHQHHHRSTVVHLDGILPEIAHQLSKDKIKEYLGQQFASDLRANLYTMSISDGHTTEQIHSQHFRGVKVISQNLSLGRGSSPFIELYVLPWEIADASISLYGRGGTRICALTDLQDFKALPWVDQRLEGFIRCDRLKRTTDKTALVQDQIYRTFVAALRTLEEKLQQLIQQVSAESQERRFNIILNRAGKLIDKFLRYREKGLLDELSFRPTGLAEQSNLNEPVKKPASPELSQELTKPDKEKTTAPGRTPFIRLDSPAQGESDRRSWYDQSQGLICINREHSEFLLSQREDRRCLRYLFSIWVKESLLQQYGAQAEKVADEMVGLLAEAEPLLW